MEARPEYLKIVTYDGLYDIQGTLSRHNTVSCLLWFDQNLRLFNLMFFCLEYPVLSVHTFHIWLANMFHIPGVGLCFTDATTPSHFRRFRHSNNKGVDTSQCQPPNQKSCEE